jgi:hypothetical protein
MINEMETPSRWSKISDLTSLQDINCTVTTVIAFRRTMFPFQDLLLKRAISNCGECDRYPCETLDRFLRTLPGARSRLDKVHREHFKNSEEQVRYEGFAGTAIILFLENIFLLV